MVEKVSTTYGKKDMTFIIDIMNLLVFFSDKGLLAVAQLLSPDAMFKVVINLDMTKTQYEQITNDYSALTTASRHLQLLKTDKDRLSHFAGLKDEKQQQTTYFQLCLLPEFHGIRG
jgi:hypothetical protein